jgi:hypothetical protein
MKLFNRRTHSMINDQPLHLLIMGVGLVCGSTIKSAFDWLGKTFWSGVIHVSRKEYQEFKTWKASLK